MFKFTLERAETWIKAFIGTAFGFVTGYLVNQMNQEALPYILAAIGIGITILFLVRTFRKPPRYEIVFREPRTIRSDWEAQAQAHRGYIGFVPLYTPPMDSMVAQMELEYRFQLIDQIDIEQARNSENVFEPFALEKSNMWPTIRALSSHAHRLEQVWLLTTQSQKQKAESIGESHPYATLLEKYLKANNLVAPTCQFHVVTIPLDDDVLVMTKTHALVEEIFRNALVGPNPLSRREIVADITTGTRAMLLGLVLACLNPYQSVQFVGTRYDARTGKPTGDIFPIVFRFALQTSNDTATEGSLN